MFFLLVVCAEVVVRGNELRVVVIFVRFIIVAVTVTVTGPPEKEVVTPGYMVMVVGMPFGPVVIIISGLIVVGTPLVPVVTIGTG
jgi:hypothetical protein